jgi:hypothetical protein
LVDDELLAYVLGESLLSRARVGEGKCEGASNGVKEGGEEGRVRVRGRGMKA